MNQDSSSLLIDKAIGLDRSTSPALSALSLPACDMEQDRSGSTPEETDPDSWNGDGRGEVPFSGKQDSRRHVAIVHWVSPRLGFGFAVTFTGKDLLLPLATAVEGLGRLPSIGMLLTCHTETRQGRERIVRCAFHEPDAADGVLSIQSGYVRSFDSSKGFGFLRLADGTEMFVGSQEMRKLGVRPPLRIGQVVTVVTCRRQKGNAVLLRLSFSSSYRSKAGF